MPAKLFLCFPFCNTLTDAPATSDSRESDSYDKRPPTFRLRALLGSAAFDSVHPARGSRFAAFPFSLCHSFASVIVATWKRLVRLTWVLRNRTEKHNR
uniref:Uncharacterized protein n=1 Tax=Ixodes ricinus TaxID=34613 RepID=A0A6B0UDZ7_IXORI